MNDKEFTITRAVLSCRNSVELDYPEIFDSVAKANACVESRLAVLVRQYMHKHYSEQELISSSADPIIRDFLASETDAELVDFGTDYDLICGTCFVGYSDWIEYNVDSVEIPIRADEIPHTSLEMPVNGGKYAVELSNDDLYPSINVGFVDKDGLWTDLAIVGTDFTHNYEQASIHIFGDPATEDSTYHTTVKHGEILEQTQSDSHIEFISSILLNDPNLLNSLKFDSYYFEPGKTNSEYMDLEIAGTDKRISYYPKTDTLMFFDGDNVVEGVPAEQQDFIRKHLHTHYQSTIDSILSTAERDR